MKDMKSRPTALPIMIFGGSPTSVAVPPIFEARIWAMRKGFTFTFSCDVMLNVIGTVRRTVVTLSSRPEQTMVNKDKAMSSAMGSAFTFFAAHMARKLNRPVSLVMLTMIIIPMSSPNVLKSIWPMAASCDKIPQSIMSMAPTIPTIVRCTRSVMIKPYDTIKIMIATKVVVSKKSTPHSKL